MGDGYARPAVKSCIPYNYPAMHAALQELEIRTRDLDDSHADDLEVWLWSAHTYIGWTTEFTEFKTTEAQRNVLWQHPYCSPLQFEASRLIIEEVG